MLRHFITFIDYAKLIEMQANQVSYVLPVDNNKKNYQNPIGKSNRKKILKMGKK